MSEPNPPDQSTASHELPVPFPIESIRQKLIGEINIRSLHGTYLSPEERTIRDANEDATKSARSEEVLSIDNPKEAIIIDATVLNSNRLKAWMDTRGLAEFEDENYRLETDPSIGIPHARQSKDSRVIEIFVNSPEFDLDYVFFRDNTFDLRIDYTQWINEERPQYRSGRQSIRTGMTSEEAEIIGVYLQDFIDSPRIPQKLAA